MSRKTLLRRRESGQVVWSVEAPGAPLPLPSAELVGIREVITREPRVVTDNGITAVRREKCGETCLKRNLESMETCLYQENDLVKYS
jgi:hypothetical protein